MLKYQDISSEDPWQKILNVVCDQPEKHKHRAVMSHFVQIWSHQKDPVKRLKNTQLIIDHILRDDIAEESLFVEEDQIPKLLKCLIESGYTAGLDKIMRCYAHHPPKLWPNLLSKREPYNFFELAVQCNNVSAIQILSRYLAPKQDHYNIFHFIACFDSSETFEACANDFKKPLLFQRLTRPSHKKRPPFLLAIERGHAALVASMVKAFYYNPELSRQLLFHQQYGYHFQNEREAQAFIFLNAAIAREKSSGEIETLKAILENCNNTAKNELLDSYLESLFKRCLAQDAVKSLAYLFEILLSTENTYRRSAFTYTSLFKLFWENVTPTTSQKTLILWWDYFSQHLSTTLVIDLSRHPENGLTILHYLIHHRYNTLLKKIFKTLTSSSYPIDPAETLYLRALKTLAETQNLLGLQTLTNKLSEGGKVESPNMLHFAITSENLVAVYDIVSGYISPSQQQAYLEAVSDVSGESALDHLQTTFASQLTALFNAMSDEKPKPLPYEFPQKATYADWHDEQGIFAPQQQREYISHRYGDTTLLHQAFQQNAIDIAFQLLRYFQKEQRCQALKIKNANDQTVLATAAKVTNITALATLLAYFQNVDARWEAILAIITRTPDDYKDLPLMTLFLQAPTEPSQKLILAHALLNDIPPAALHVNDNAQNIALLKRFILHDSPAAISKILLGDGNSSFLSKIIMRRDPFDALELAVRFNKERVFRFLLKQLNPTQTTEVLTRKNKNHQTLLHVILFFGHSEMLVAIGFLYPREKRLPFVRETGHLAESQFLNYEPKDDTTAYADNNVFHFIACSGSIDCFKLLVQWIADPQETSKMLLARNNGDGYQPLATAVSLGQTALIPLILGALKKEHDQLQALLPREHTNARQRTLIISPVLLAAKRETLSYPTKTDETLGKLMTHCANNVFYRLFSRDALVLLTQCLLLKAFHSFQYLTGTVKTIRSVEEKSIGWLSIYSDTTKEKPYSNLYIPTPGELLINCFLTDHTQIESCWRFFITTLKISPFDLLEQSTQDTGETLLHFAINKNCLEFMHQIFSALMNAVLFKENLKFDRLYKVKTSTPESPNLIYYAIMQGRLEAALLLTQEKQFDASLLMQTAETTGLSALDLLNRHEGDEEACSQLRAIIENAEISMPASHVGVLTM